MQTGGAIAAAFTGIPQTVIDTFCKRRNEIEEVLAESGNTSARAAQVATLDTPRRKDFGVDAETLLARWRVEAAAAGFDARRFEACFGRAAVEAVTDTQVARLYECLGGPAGLTERCVDVRADRCDRIDRQRRRGLVHRQGGRAAGGWVLGLGACRGGGRCSDLNRDRFQV